MDVQNARFYRFGPFSLYPSQGWLEKEGAQVRLAPKPFDLLVLLVANHGNLLSKEGIINHLWPDVVVTEYTLTTTISTVRKALGDTEEKYIENVPKKGYRFRAEVQEATEDSLAKTQPAVPASKWHIGGITTLLFLTAVLLMLGLWFVRMRTRATMTDQQYLNEALNYERLGDDSLALDALDRAISANPNAADAYLKAAFIASDIDQDERAEAYLKRAETLSGREGDDFVLKTQGLRKLFDGNPDEALSRFRLASDKYRGDVDAHAVLAETALDLDHYPEAEIGIQRCLAVDPNNPECLFTAMFLDLQRNNFDAVLQRYNELKRAGLVYPYWEAPAGLACLGKDDLSAAILHFQKLEGASLSMHGQLHSRVAKDWFAETAFYRGRFQEARDQLTEAQDSSKSPNEKGEYLAALARQYVILGQSEQAKSALGSAIQATDSWDIRKQAATIYAMLGARTEALGSLSVGGPYPATQHTVSGLLALAAGQTKLASEELTRGYEQDHDPETGYWLGVALVRAGRWDEASSRFQEIINSKGLMLAKSLTAYWVLAHYQQAICFQKRQLTAQALQRYEEFLSFWKDADPEVTQVHKAKNQVELLSRARSQSQQTTR